MAHPTLSTIGKTPTSPTLAADPSPQPAAVQQPGGQQPPPHPLSSLHNPPPNAAGAQLADLLSQPPGAGTTGRPRKTAGSTAGGNKVSRLSFSRLAKAGKEIGKETRRPDSSGRASRAAPDASRVTFREPMPSAVMHFGVERFGLPADGNDLAKLCRDESRVDELCAKLNAWIANLPPGADAEAEQVMAFQMTHAAMRACDSGDIHRAMTAVRDLVDYVTAPVMRPSFIGNGMEEVGRVNLADAETGGLRRAVQALEANMANGEVTLADIEAQLAKLKSAVVRNALNPLITFIRQFPDNSVTEARKT